MDPITAIAAFNLAAATVKEAANHAGDMMSLFKGIGDMMKAKDVIDKAAKNNSGKSDIELYAAKVEVEETWEEVKQLLIWSGHWDKYLMFCSDRRENERQDRLRVVREREKKRKFYEDVALIIGAVIGGLLTVVGFLWAILTTKG